MAARKRDGAVGHRTSAQAAAEWERLGAPPRTRSKLRWVLAALGTSTVVLGITIYVGSLLGANEFKRPGQTTPVNASGETIYLNNCAACHGPNGEGGRVAGAPAFTTGGALASLTFEQRVAKISRGRPLRGMPAWKFQISEEDIRRVAAYTQLLSGRSAQPDVEEVR